jgi:hypothetical protein
MYICICMCIQSTFHDLRVIKCMQVRANGVGSKYIITDHGLAPDKTQAPSTLRKVKQILLSAVSCVYYLSMFP